MTSVEDNTGNMASVVGAPLVGARNAATKGRPQGSPLPPTRRQFGRPLKSSFIRATRDETEFLPAALEVLETPASPVGRAIAATIILFAVLAVAWATFGYVDIIATAPGKIVPTGRTKTIQALEPGIVTAIRVRDGDIVSAGQMLIELDRTVIAAERGRIAHDLRHARLDVARLKALRAGLDAGTAPVGFAPPADAPAEEGDS
jgi:hemolysin D